jgi:hypothetical protein
MVSQLTSVLRAERGTLVATESLRKEGDVERDGD